MQNPAKPSNRVQWAATVAATCASTYALDAIAAGLGVALVASGMLTHLSHPQTLLFLAASYIAWGTGLRANLIVNADLLARTGISASLLSKLAYEAVKARTISARARRIVASSGYVATELIKEAPYYVGAIAAAFVSDAVATTELVLFLAGANFGAALYEWALARSSRAVLSRLQPVPAGSFDDDWVPREYLTEYYADLGPDEEATIAFFVDKIRLTAPYEPILFAGTGPTLHHVFLAAERASEIHLADYLPGNLDELRDWLDRDPAAHDWTRFISHTLECEGTAPTPCRIEERAGLVRAKTTRLLPLDLRRANPLGPDATYSTVISGFCADSATADFVEWQVFMDRLAALVRPEGALLTAALHRATGYKIGARTFPSANVSATDLRRQMERAFRPEDITIRVCDVPGGASRGYSQILLACGLNRRLQADMPRKG